MVTIYSNHVYNPPYLSLLINGLIVDLNLQEDSTKVSIEIGVWIQLLWKQGSKKCGLCLSHSVI